MWSNSKRGGILNIFGVICNLNRVQASQVNLLLFMFQVWFQNRRAKCRKQENQMHKGKWENNNNKKIRD